MECVGVECVLEVIEDVIVECSYVCIYLYCYSLEIVCICCVLNCDGFVDEFWIFNNCRGYMGCEFLVGIIR